MAILSGFKRVKEYLTDADGNHLAVSRWTDSTAVELANGKALDEYLDNPVNIDDIDSYFASYSASGEITYTTTVEPISESEIDDMFKDI